ncbi:MAG: hypothetical protein KGI41_00690 [Patescibacteria group bacterium]|nr:hypothetical protein [Patescibacteria group bacterium]MDE1965746.1 hypothetical protein [Patescibacteria group bacterium]
MFIRLSGTVTLLRTIRPYSYLGGNSHTPDLLPHGTWITLAGETRTEPDGSVLLRLSMKDAGGAWRTLLIARDDDFYGGTPPIRTAGSYGLRTDFMDVKFRDIRITQL